MNRLTLEWAPLWFWPPVVWADMERRIVSLVLNPTNPIRCLQALLHNSDHKILISIPEQISSGWWHWAQPLVFSLPQWRRWDHQWPGAGPVLLLSDWCLWLIHDQLGSPRADAVLYQVGPGNNSWEGATLSRDQAPVSGSQITLATRWYFYHNSESPGIMTHDRPLCPGLSRHYCLDPTQIYQL